MDELYRVGQSMASEQAGALDPAAMQEALASDPALREILAGNGDLESYLQNYEQLLAQGIEQGPQLNVVDAEGGITVRPDPGFVIKTRDVNSGMKIFINVVSNEHIERPHMKSLEELQGEEGCRVPLSVGTPVDDFDKKKEPCVTYDVVANPEIVEESQKQPAFRENLVSLCLAAIGQKYKIELDARYKLPKMKYKGNTVQIQRIRKSRQSDIQEVSSSTKAPMPGEMTAKRNQNGGIVEVASSEDGDGRKVPDFRIFYSKQGGPSIDAFDEDWPQPPDDLAEASAQAHLNGLDLPCYRVNEFQERIRGILMNKAEREKRETTAEDATAAALQETKDFIEGRLCVVQVRLPDLERNTPSLKQFGVDISDECLKVTFPLLPRQNRAAYLPLTLWWPMPFHSAQAVADWEPSSDTLTVVLPVDRPMTPPQAEE